MLRNTGQDSEHNGRDRAHGGCTWPVSQGLQSLPKPGVPVTTVEHHQVAAAVMRTNYSLPDGQIKQLHYLTVDSMQSRRKVRCALQVKGCEVAPRPQARTSYLESISNTCDQIRKRLLPGTSHARGSGTLDDVVELELERPYGRSPGCGCRAAGACTAALMKSSTG